jgi:hypothetical protein
MASEQTAASKRGLLATRGRKIAAAIGAAFLATLGAGLGARALNSAESATKNALGGSEAALDVRVVEPDTFPVGHPYAPYYVIPKSELSGPEKLDHSELEGNQPFDFAYAQRHQAVPGSPEIVRLQFRARGDEPVTINDIKIDVVQRSAPLDGWYIAQPGCGGLVVKIAEVDLDTPTPTVRYIGQGAPEENITLFVTRTDIEVIELQVGTEKSMVDWTAEVFYSGPDGDGSVTVDDDGRPFRVTTETGSDAYTVTGFPNIKIVREHSWDANGIFAC